MWLAVFHSCQLKVEVCLCGLTCCRTALLESGTTMVIASRLTSQKTQIISATRRWAELSVLAVAPSRVTSFRFSGLAPARTGVQYVLGSQRSVHLA